MSDLRNMPESYWKEKLTPEQYRVCRLKGTERAFTGEYTDLKDPGTYVCRRCNAPLYRSDDKFASDCGWPSFDDEIKGAVKQVADPDGFRTALARRWRRPVAALRYPAVQCQRRPHDTPRRSRRAFRGMSREAPQG